MTDIRVLFAPDGFPAICPNCGRNADNQTGCCIDLKSAKEREAALVEALERIMDNLGVPQPDYPYPVAHAYDLAKEALANFKGRAG